MRVAIIGTAPGSRTRAPLEDPSWKIWACSQGNQGVLSRVDAWFELHPISALTGEEHRAWAVPFLAWLRVQAFPVYVIEKTDLLPQAIQFPAKRMVELFGRNWFTSSVTWMMAYALSQMSEGDEIGLFGIDMASWQEHYTAQRAGIWRFLEIAKERGVKVHIPHESCLGQSPPLYGYSEATNMGRKLHHRQHELQTQRNNLAAQVEKLVREVAYYDGAIEQNNYMIRTFLDGEDAVRDLFPAEKPTANIPLDGPPPKPPLVTGDFQSMTASGLLVPRGTPEPLMPPAPPTLPVAEAPMPTPTPEKRRRAARGNGNGHVAEPE